MPLSPSILRVGNGYPVRAPQRLRCPLFSCFALLMLLSIGFFALPVAASAQGVSPGAIAKFAPDLQADIITAARGSGFRVIVQATSPGLAPALNSSVRKADALLPLDASGTYVGKLTVEQALRLAAEANVLQISPDRPIFSCADYAMQAVGADVAETRCGLTGRGVTVAVLDTGIKPHLDLASTRIVGWLDLVNKRTSPYDDNGHGTHVAGMLGGNGNASSAYRYSTRLRRTAPEAQVVGVKVLDKNGGGQVSTVIAGIDWCISNRVRFNIRIINLSLGHPVAESYTTDPLCRAVERAWNAGILVVCAAGNLGRRIPSDPNSPPANGTILSPGNDPYVLTVGAANTKGTSALTDDGIASYSSRGPSAMDFILKPDIVAPGNDVDSVAASGSLLYNGYTANRVAPAWYGGTGTIQYFRLSGTSMATPIVAGAAALMLQADPSLTPDAVKARLMVSATKPLDNDPFTWGAGYLNIPAALSIRIGAPLGARSPRTRVMEEGFVTIDDATWNDNAVWGNNAIWGNYSSAYKTIWGRLQWNDNAIWGNSLWDGGAVSPPATQAELTSILLEGD